MQRREFLAAMLLASLEPLTALAAESPREFVIAVYRGAAASGATSWDVLLARAMGRKRPFSKSFDAALKAADAKSRKTQEPWLDFDPVSNSQDPSIHGLSVNVVSDTPKKATISAEFRSAPGPKAIASQVIYDFVRENKLWVLDNIRGGILGKKSTAWSLQKLARDSVARP